jgi:hypothetical protein
MSEFLQDTLVEADPFAECREAIAALEDGPFGNQLVMAAMREGISPQGLIDAILEDAEQQMAAGSIVGSDLFLRQNEQMRTPAFLRYLTGLMGSM